MSTAVILAARKERDSELPYPLLHLDGEPCLLERILRQLKERHYEQIYIVAGHCAELFRAYEDHQTRVVVNEDYMFTASMGSLAKLEGFIKEDFLLIEGDTFYEGRVFDELAAHPSGNCLAIADESGSGDEAFVEVQAGFVTKVSKDHHQIKQYAGELLGVMKITLPTFQAMIAAWNLANNPYLNYEYLFLDCTQVLDRPYIFFSDLIWGDVDDQEDLDKLKRYIIPKLRRRENPFDKANLQEHIIAIGKALNLPIPTDCELAAIGGLSNKNYKVHIGESDYVLRVPGLGSAGMSERAAEEQNGIKASSLGINPPIRYFDASTGIKFADYIEGAETLNSATIQRPLHIRQVAEVLSTLHNAAVRFANDFNVFLEIHRYESLIQREVSYPEFAKYRPKILDLERHLDSLGVILAPCHNDTVAENFVRDASGKLYLIDWEYSGMNDPMWDIAALFLESSFSEDNQLYFLRSYFGREASREEREKMQLYQILMDWLWALWTVVKEENGDDFGSYGLDRYQRAISSYNNWINSHRND